MGSERLLARRYRVSACLGRGAHGEVRLAEDTTSGETVALKVIQKKGMEAQRLEQEIGNHSGMQHANVLTLQEVIETPDVATLVLEHAEGGDLEEHIMRHVRIPEEDARLMFRQLTDAVAYCHDSGVVHRDIKPANILLTSDLQVKLGDFGLSARIPERGTLLTDPVGTPHFAAPELLCQRCEYQGEGVDVWSCGVVLYVILAGRLPFDAPDLPGIFRQIRKGQFFLPGHFSREAADLVRRMLTRDPAERPSLAEVQQHPWVLGCALPAPTPVAAAAPCATAAPTTAPATAPAKEEECHATQRDKSPAMAWSCDDLVSHVQSNAKSLSQLATACTLTVLERQSTTPARCASTRRGSLQQRGGALRRMRVGGA